MSKRIAVLYGGLSSEREVSLKTGKAVYDALVTLGYETHLIDVDREVDKKIREFKPDYCFIALHGKYGEDGTIQGMLEVMGIPYSGADHISSAIAYDKHYTKIMAEKLGVLTPEYYLAKNEYDARFFPCVVKPAREGSTIGVSIVNEKNEFEKGYRLAKKYDSKVLVERFIKGKELTVGIVNEEVFPVIWIKPVKGFYDYESKYTKGLTEYLFETGLSKEEEAKVKEIALSFSRNIGCSKLCRVDFIFDGKDFYMLEVNTIPGMTETSLLPKAAAKAGYSFNELIDLIITECK
ncbi:D-alanine--D-alanine ligase [Deferribacter autotrophicus]|uniref:D-alanine--D-alanine ligase n=1 Tax=Deferribacter autotrophicus TaxID=500465 RepID=A0A5A8F5C2_9BACT|nr:D-alanine--D-alanine ligase [Deferribacter autotrophicus]KAA0257862.1 D-alanine--D-alanine ligase [Deferribacter autotrophicus]